MHAKSAFALCDTTYRLDGPINGNPPRVFHGERRLTVLQAKVPVTNWPTYKKWYGEAEAASVPYLQLVRVSAGSNRIPIRNLPITGGPGGKSSLPPPEIEIAPDRPADAPPAGATGESLVNEAREQLRDPLAARKLLGRPRPRAGRVPAA